MHETIAGNTREKVLEVLTQRNKTLVKAIDSISTGVSISDPIKPNNPLIYCNNAFCEITGYSFEEVLSRNCSFLQGCGTDRETVAKLGAAIAAKNSITVEILNYRKDGRTFWNLLTIFPVFDEQGGVINFVGTQQDITEFKKAKEERVRLEQELEQSTKFGALGSLAGGIAHEINTPIQYIGDNLRFIQEAIANLLAIVDSQCHLIKGIEEKGMLADHVVNCRTEYERKDVDFLRDELPVATEQAIDGVTQITNIVQAMKEFIHPIHKKMAPVDLNNVIERSITLCRPQWKQLADLKFEPDIHLAPVIANEASLNQVVVNLIVNAAHAVGQLKEGQGKITIQTRENDGSIQLQITDNGVGISENVRPKIFERYFTTKDIGEGTGQGLALVYDVVVTKLGGNIDVKSIVGKGTTFIINIPI